MPDYYDRNGDPIRDMLEWGARFSDKGYQRVALDKLPNNVEVSTVWLGLDHNWGNGPPLIFETTVFGVKAVNGDQYQDRYTTEERAREGHRRIVESEKSGTPLSENGVTDG